MKKRIIYLDVLRVLAIFGVVLLHVSVPLTVEYKHAYKSYWWSANIFSSISRYCVPIFLMISGRLMLDDKNLDMKSFYKKRIPYLLVSLLTISLIQYVFSYVVGSIDHISLKNFIYKLLTDQIHPHLWYLYTIIGIYLLTPILKYFAQYSNKKELKLFLIISFLISVLSKLFSYYTSEEPAFLNTIFTWSISYFVLGFYIDKYGLEKKSLYNKLAVFSLFLGILGTYYLTIGNNRELNDIFYSFIMPTAIFPSISLFLITKDIDWSTFFHRHPNIYKSLLRLSKTSFGVYLIHSFPIRIFSYFIDIYRLNFPLAIPLITLLIWISSHLIVLFLGELYRLIFH